MTEFTMRPATDAEIAFAEVQERDRVRGLRDQFAIAALKGIIAQDGSGNIHMDEYRGRRAYEIADAMMKARDYATDISGAQELYNASIKRHCAPKSSSDAGMSS